VIDVYVRASEGDANGGYSSDPYEQEAEALAWLSRHGLEHGEVVPEVVSGSVAAEDRELGRLIGKVERGESAGIVVFDERRFARSIVAGGIAFARVVRAGGRFIATRSGFDSADLTPESKMIFDFMMSMGEQELERNRLRRMHGKRKAAERGVWCAAAPPVGYDRDADGKLVPNGDADTVREIFRLRAEGVSFSEIARTVGEVTATNLRGHRSGERSRRRMSRGGIRHVVSNRAYLGVQVIPRPGMKIQRREGDEPLEVENSCPPLVTRQEWDAANNVPGAAPPVRRNLVEVYGAELKGVIRCGACTDYTGRPSVLHVLEPGRYACCRCGKTAMNVSKADRAVAEAFRQAVENGTSEVLAIANDASAYEEALDAVERAADVLTAYRDSTDLQQVLGLADWTEGLRVRKEAYEQARRALREQGPAPRRVTDARKLLRESLHAFIAEVIVYPKRNGGPRLTVRWRGADEAVPVEA
jgi:DNA invertase Pin-like site-specific DNA recombinase